jgi:glycosyltransferase involved in cell wall biosynthesis
VNPVVSIVIPTLNRPDLLLTRSLPSVRNQTYQNLDIHIIGDGVLHYSDMRILWGLPNDPRVRYTNRPAQKYPPDSYDAWLVSGSAAVNHGIDTAKGEWICCCADDDEMTPAYIETLLGFAERYGFGAVYCPVEVLGAIFPRARREGDKVVLGTWPPTPAGQSYPLLWRKNNLRYSTDCWTTKTPNDWDFWTRMMNAGVRFGYYAEPLFRFHPSVRQAVSE